MSLIKQMLKGLLAVVVTVMAVFTFADKAYADTASELMSGESIGASKIINTNAYNDASTENLGVERRQEVIEDFSNLVMANVKSVLSMRSEPSLEAEIVGKMYKDCGGTIIERAEEWTLVQTGDITGWCRNQFLFFNEEAEALAKEVGSTSAIINEECVVVRDAPSEDGNIIGFAARDSIFEVILETEGWACIAYDDYDGYVKLDYITLDFEVDAGESMEAINERKRLEKELRNSVEYKKQKIKDDANDLKLLASIIWCEARGEPFEGMVAVGAVVMNRLNSPAYPNTMFGVIFASGQFSPVKRGGIYLAYNKNANAICYEAARLAMSGYSNVGTVTHFRRKGKILGIEIGNHVFY